MQKYTVRKPGVVHGCWWIQLDRIKARPTGIMQVCVHTTVSLALSRQGSAGKAKQRMENTAADVVKDVAAGWARAVP